jgi:hypothetical protein
LCQRENARELALELKAVLAVVRNNPDLVDQAAQRLECLPALLGVAEQHFEGTDAGPIYHGKVGMQERLLFGAHRQLPGQSRLLRFQLLELDVDGLGIATLKDHVHEALDLPVYTFQLAPHGGVGGRCLRAALVDLGDELARKLLEQRRLHEVRLEAVEDCILDIVAANRDAVGAGGPVAGTRARKSAGAVLGVVCATHTALHQAG